MAEIALVYLSCLALETTELRPSPKSLLIEWQQRPPCEYRPASCSRLGVLLFELPRGMEEPKF